jgi:hypothetical protein
MLGVVWSSGQLATAAHSARPQLHCTLVFSGTPGRGRPLHLEGSECSSLRDGIRHSSCIGRVSCIRRALGIEGGEALQQTLRKLHTQRK